MIMWLTLVSNDGEVGRPGGVTLKEGREGQPKPEVGYGSTRAEPARARGGRGRRPLIWLETVIEGTMWVWMMGGFVDTANLLMD